ncbi:hypothetical protein ABQ354_20470 [Citrobacter freundii]|uniref:hypothetical protein n=1 Tax=Citrobacter freundii TaxID=546 RepID=UPI003AAF6085
MAKLSFSQQKKLEESLKYIPLPKMCNADDNLWIKSYLKRLPERYRQEVANLYSIIFLRKLHDRNLHEMKRISMARRTANVMLYNIVDLFEKRNKNDNDC